MQAYVPELNLSIGPVNYDWCETDRPGFTVHAEVPGVDKEAGYLHAFKGYALSNNDGHEVVVEPDTLHIRYVFAESHLPGNFDTCIKGVGAALVRRAIEHATENGLMHGRTEAINPRIISILEKLRREGSIGELELYGGLPLLQTVARLRETGELVTPSCATELLSRRHKRNSDPINSYIRAIFDL